MKKFVFFALFLSFSAIVIANNESEINNNPSIKVEAPTSSCVVEVETSTGWIFEDIVLNGNTYRLMTDGTMVGFYSNLVIPLDSSCSTCVVTDPSNQFRFTVHKSGTTVYDVTVEDLTCS